MKKLRIAQVAPAWYSVPPKKYGGAEWIIAGLCDGLVERGHQVTLFANADSKTKAKLISAMKKSPEISQETLINFEYNMKHIFNHFLAVESQKQFDLIHWHISKDLLPLMLSNIIATPSVVTFHNYYPTANIDSIYKYYKKNLQKNVYLVSISKSYTQHLPFKFFATVYNGIDMRPFHPCLKKDQYLFWIGRFLPVKGPHLAIEVAKKLNLPLKLAARKVGNLQLEYFNTKIKPNLKGNIEYVGELGLREKAKIYEKASVLLNPIIWDEPYGLVVPEANACATPVVAFARGSMPELIKEGVNGFLIKPDDIDGMVKTIKKILAMSKNQYESLCLSSRRYVEENFTVQKMVSGYEEVYEKVIADYKSKAKSSNVK